MRSRWFSGSIGSAGWFGNVPSSSGYRCTRVIGRRSNTGGTTSPPMPFAVSATTVSGRIADTSTNESTCSTYASSISSRRDGARGRAGRERVAFGQVADLTQAGVLPDGPCAGEAELHPVVLGRVVARRQHDARDRARAGCEVQEIGRGEPDVDDVGPARRDALAERGGERRGREAAVPPDRDGLDPGPLGERGPDRARDILVELVGDDAADVVRLEEASEISVRRHGHRIVLNPVGVRFGAAVPSR